MFPEFSSPIVEEGENSDRTEETVLKNQSLGLEADFSDSRDCVARLVPREGGAEAVSRDVSVPTGRVPHSLGLCDVALWTGHDLVFTEPDEAVVKDPERAQPLHWFDYFQCIVFQRLSSDV